MSKLDNQKYNNLVIEKNVGSILKYTFFCKDVEYQYLLSALLPRHKHYVETCVTEHSLLRYKQLTPHNSINWSADISTSGKDEVLELLEFSTVHESEHTPTEAMQQSRNLNDAILVNDLCLLDDGLAGGFASEIVSIMKEGCSPALLVTNSSVLTNIEIFEADFDTALLIEPKSKQCFTVIANFELSGTPALNVGNTSIDKQSNSRKAERWRDKLENLPKDVQLLLLSRLLSDTDKRN